MLPPQRRNRRRARCATLLLVIGPLFVFAMGVGALCTALVGFGSDPALTAAIILAAAGVIGQLSFWIALRYRPKAV